MDWTNPWQYPAIQNVLEKEGDIMGIIDFILGPSNPWLLLIAIWTGNAPEDTKFFMHVRMESQAACMQAAQDMTTTFGIFQHLNPDLHIQVMCREDMPVRPYQEASVINYRECLDLLKK